MVEVQGLAALAFVMLGGLSPSIVPQKMAQAMNSFPLVAAPLFVLMGNLLGGLAGYVGGWLDNALMRILDTRSINVNLEDLGFAERGTRVGMAGVGGDPRQRLNALVGEGGGHAHVEDQATELVWIVFR